ncbi:hypothetical protein ACJRO7_025076 [Eucalyptus globulus]|uniref:Uncharacterized protein n=1 Tax=Eucalyptus globulus TaxID=34317 RepID=A0ABD3K7R0_EUCGL
MLPMSIRCNTRGNYISGGTKFNSREEEVVGDTYLGIEIFRFYLKCTECSAELTIKTDPRNSDYVVEWGVTGNFEPWRELDEVVKNAKRRRAAEETGNAMKSLENKTLDSKKEMNVVAALDEMKSMKSRHTTVSVDSMLEALQSAYAAKEKKLEEKETAAIKSIVFHIPKILRMRKIYATNEKSLNNNLKKRKFSEEFPDKPADALAETTSRDIWNDRGKSAGSQDRSESKLLLNSSLVRIAVVKKAAPISSLSASVEGTKQDKADKKGGGSSFRLQSKCQNYGISIDDD